MKHLWDWLLNLAPGKLAGGEWHVGFTADWNNYVKLGLIAALIGLVVLVVYCYRREGNTSKRLKGGLAAIRIAVIVLVILILFQPAIIVDLSEKIYNTVVVLVDDSRSMAHHDAYQAEEVTALRQRLATKLGVNESELAELSRSEIITRLLGRKDSVLAKLNESHPVELMKFSTDSPGKQAYTQTLGSLGRESGLKQDITVPAADPKKNAESAEGSSAEDEPAVVNGETPSENKGAPAAKNVPMVTKTVTVSEMLAKLQASGHHTNFSRTLRNMNDRLQGRRIGAVVLITDGQATNPDAQDRLAAALEYIGPKPRYTVMVGDPTPPKNLVVHSLNAPREVRAGSPVIAEAIISQRNLTGKTANVSLYRRLVGKPWPKDMNSLEPVMRKAVKLTGKKDTAAGDGQQRGSQTVELQFIPKEKDMGEYVYRAVVREQPGEQNKTDNHAEAFIKISDSKIRVLLVSADSGWEFQYLKNYFVRQPDLYRLSVWQQNADPEVNQAHSSGMKLTRLPRNLKELIDTEKDKARNTSAAAKKPVIEDKSGKKKDVIPPGYDVVILYDPMPTDKGYDPHFWGLLKEYVAKHQGGLCYIASHRNSLEVLEGQYAQAAKPLADLLPVKLTRSKDWKDLFSDTRPKPWPLYLTAYGSEHSITKLEATATDNREIWKLLPGIFRSHSVMKTKPLARILLEHSNPERKTRLKGLPEPLLVTQTVGKGRVVYMGFDETWRWRFAKDGYYYRRFWSNLVRFLAPLHARQVLITAGGDRFGAGDEITLEVEAYDENFKPMMTDTFPLTMTNAKTKKVRHITLRAIMRNDENGKKVKTGRFKATIVADRTGTYVLNCDEKIAPADRVTAKQISIELPQAEARRTEADPSALEAIASKPSHLLYADQIDELSKLIPSEPLVRKDKRIHPLWDTPLILLLLAVLLAVEWFVRKRNNMA